MRCWPLLGRWQRKQNTEASPLCLPKTERPFLRSIQGSLVNRDHKDTHLSYFNIRREPLSLVNLRKRNLESGEELASRLDHYKAKATRHIFLIRHSQYHTEASLAKDRTLTPLGMWLGLGPQLNVKDSLLEGIPRGTGPP